METVEYLSHDLSKNKSTIVFTFIITFSSLYFFMSYIIDDICKFYVNIRDYEHILLEVHNHTKTLL